MSKSKIWISTDPKFLSNEYLINSLFDHFNTHPLYGTFGYKLYQSLQHNTEAFIPSSFSVMYDDDPILIVFCTRSSDEISFYGLPVVIAIRKDIGRKREKSAFSAAFKNLTLIANENNIPVTKILGGINNSPLNSIDLACIGQFASINSQINAIVDLSNNEAVIRKNLRDSYRSLINWGSRQLDMKYINSDNPDRDMFDAYPSFHSAIAGAGAREISYWNIFWDEIVSGTGELALGYSITDGSLVSGTMVIDAYQTCYYASGVYDREKFENPLGHFPVYNSILRAKERGMAIYDLGEIHPKNSYVSDKEKQISFFKKGFTSVFNMRFIWELHNNQN